jgi:hypothetical protein
VGCLIWAALSFTPRPVSAGPGGSPLRAEQDEASQTIKIYHANGKDPVVTVNVRHDARPYLHPIVAPDGRGIMTEYRPPHHLHQTGVFWGFKYINNRDFFMKWEGDNYRRVSAKVVRATGPRVQWQTVYDLLDESGKTVLTETQNWSMQNPETGTSSISIGTARLGPTSFSDRSTSAGFLFAFRGIRETTPKR